MLYHYGVKGMKWGVRKDKYYETTGTSQKKKSKVDDSEAIAARNRKIKMILAVAGGVAVVAATAYLAKKYHLNFASDKVIPPQTVLQNMNIATKMDLNDSFYVAYKNIDKKKYLGIYGHALEDRAVLGEVKKTMVSVGDSGLKVVSHKNAKDIFAKTFNNKKDIKTLKTFAKDAGFFNNNYGVRRLAIKSSEELKRGQIGENTYKLFNVYGNYDVDGKNLQKRFFNVLKEKGYGGIEDLNDKIYSGYKSKNPLIVFGGDKVLDIKSEKTVEVGHEIIHKQYLKEFGKLKVSNLKLPAIAVGGLGAAGEISELQAEKKYVEDYRKEHPNSTLSFEKILEIREEET